MCGYAWSVVLFCQSTKFCGRKNQSNQGALRTYDAIKIVFEWNQSVAFWYFRYHGNLEDLEDNQNTKWQRGWIKRLTRVRFNVNRFREWVFIFVVDWNILVTPTCQLINACAGAWLVASGYCWVHCCIRLCDALWELLNCWQCRTLVQ